MIQDLTILINLLAGNGLYPRDSSMKRPLVSTPVIGQGQGI